MNIGKNIKKIRKDRNLSQAEFSNLIGISRSYLSDLENNRKSPSIETVNKISQKIDVSSSYLLTGYTDLLGNEMPVSDLSYYSSELTDLYDKHSLKQSNIIFLYLAIKLFKGTDLRFSIIRITVSLNKDGIKELFIENCPEFYEINSSTKSKNFLGSTPVRNDLDSCVNFNSYVKEKNKISDDSVEHLFQSIKEFTCDALNQKNNSNLLCCYIDYKNKLVKF